jgi:hypothetical protein
MFLVTRSQLLHTIVSYRPQYIVEISFTLAAMDKHLSGQPEIDWDGFTNLPQTPDLTAQSPFSLDEPQVEFHHSQKLPNIDINAIVDVDDSYR